jgi:hypothetical protein
VAQDLDTEDNDFQRGDINSFEVKIKLNCLLLDIRNKHVHKKIFLYLCLSCHHFMFIYLQDTELKDCNGFELPQGQIGALTLIHRGSDAWGPGEEDQRKHLFSKEYL